MLVYRYLRANFLQSFISIFITLFVIVSVIMLIQISRLLSGVDVDMIDVLKLYLYASVKLLLITMPLSFFLAVSMCINRLCKDNELIVLFTLGLRSIDMMRFFVKISLVVSVFLSVVAFVFIPITLRLQENFVDYKKLVSTISIKPSSYGQEFGSWLVFVGEKTNDTYKDIIMYQPAQKSTHNKILILARLAQISNVSSQITLKLQNGTLYEFSDKTYSAEFDELEIYTQIQTKLSTTQDVLEYWSDYKGKRAKELVIYMLLALFPLASVFFAVGAGLVIARYERNLIYLRIFVILLPYFSVISLLYQYHIFTIVANVALYLIAGRMYFVRKAVGRF